MPLTDSRLKTGQVTWQRRQVLIKAQLDTPAELGFRDRASDIAVAGNIELQLPRPHRAAGLSFRFPDGKQYLLAAPGFLAETTARISAIPSAAAEVWSARVQILQFLANGDPSIAANLRLRFGLTPASDHAVIVPDDLFCKSHASTTPPTTIVIPVFNAADDVQRLLTRLPDTLPQTVQVVLIDDGSTDARIVPLLEAFAKAFPGTQIVRHEQNLGFVAAVNSGFASARPDDHVVLLNTDTLPPDGWVPRLLAPIVTAPTKVASVTPFSNNAEILSIPMAGTVADPCNHMVDAIDHVARQIRPSLATLPTGIGFCMAINRAFLDRIGMFDPAFGRGYGEEVDWCRRASLAGGRHVSAPLFVGHRGGASFGSEKAARLKKAAAIISERYPTFDHDVQQWIADAPLGAEKLALSIAWLAEANEETVIFLGHSLGGGAEQALQDDVAAQLSGGASGVVILRVSGARTWRVELHTPHCRFTGEASAHMVHQLLGPLHERRVVYSCGVGAPDPTEVPRMLARLCRAQTSSFEIRLHDFFPVSPSWNLLDDTGWFHGVPARETTQTVHQPGGSTGITHFEWRQSWQQLVEQAERITVFAPSGADLFCQAYPDAIGKIVLRPHKLPQRMPGRIAPGGQSIGILGGINRAKGGAVIEALSRRTNRRIVVVGEMDGQFRLRKPHLVHGRYNRTRITRLAKSYDIGLWLIPSICPETFSFATHEALATGLPVLGFDLGAQADALRPAPNGHVLDLGPHDTFGLAAAIETHFTNCQS